MTHDPTALEVERNEAAWAEMSWKERYLDEACRHEQTRKQAITALSQARDAALEEGWQPIETAPRDQTEILVFVPSRSPPVFTAQYIDGWSASTEGRYAPEDDFYGDEDFEPTHWRPLPAPPGNLKGGSREG